ncbi:tripartite tricarboxylate transporter substrate binding protein [Pigmentiphaga sp. H8]|uniref:Bug family tripartite tricarboxylate transporter substrate binding protein n=1 Tax=Pigmentiphaga sp. H8 TaxID=2488560 RepID=UPI000F5B0890|nr:tripartite tricarboxylate transporter substrate binding protein [Pigmentiphaga sp. H8]AZG08975.1 tripartite tricarboxylate transporter substrate binding protein [Pigmentiphaga sp. H8]
MKTLRSMGLCAVAFAAQGLPAAQAAYPDKPVTIVVPFAAGSPTDAVARVVAEALSKRLGQSMVVQNRPGATGMIGSEYVARAQPDGYTLLFGTNTTQVANQYFFKKVSYDGLKDFAPVAVVGGVPHALVVNPSVPVNSVAELIAYAKAHPGKLSFPYANSTTRITGSTFRVMTKTEINAIPYKAYGQAIAELLGGQTQMMFIDFSTGLSYMITGKLKALAITPDRSAKLPGVPAMKEVLPGFEIGNWNGLFAPAGTSPEIIDRLNREVRAVLEQPELRKQVDGVGYELLPPMAPAEFGKYIAEESRHYARLTSAADIKPE